MPRAPKTAAETLKLPASWSALPDTVALEVEVDWVHANLCFCRNETGRLTIEDVERAASPVPSKGALTWMQFALSAPTKFSEMYARIKGKGEGGEDERVREERMAIREIERILEKLDVRQKRG